MGGGVGRPAAQVIENRGRRHLFPRVVCKRLSGARLPCLEGFLPNLSIHHAPRGKNRGRLIELKLITNLEIQPLPDRLGNGDLSLAGNCCNHGDRVRL